MNIKVEIKKILKGDKPTKAYANIVIYSNGKELMVSKKDFDRTFITFVTSPPEVIEREFCNKGVETK